MCYKNVKIEFTFEKVFGLVTEPDTAAFGPGQEITLDTGRRACIARPARVGGAAQATIEPPRWLYREIRLNEPLTPSA